MKLFLSRNPEKASLALYKEIRKSLECGRRAYLVVPSQFTLEAEQTLFDFLSEKVLMKAQVKSFQSLMRDILESSGRSKFPSISNRGMRMLIRFIISRSEEMEEIFPKNSSGKGLSERILKSLLEWQDYEISVARIREMGENFSQEDHSAKKLRALADLYEKYEELTRGNFFDSNAQMKYAFDKLENEDLFPNTDFFFDRFNSMSKLEIRNLKRLSKDHKISMTMTIDPDLALEIDRGKKGNPFFSIKDLDFNKIQDLQYFSFPANFLIGLLAQFANLEIVKANENDKEEGQELYNFYAYDSIEDEIIRTLIEIRKIKEKEGAKWDDFLIYLADPDEYKGLISRIFTVEGVPYFYDQIKSSSFHPLIQTISAFLSLQKKGWRRAPILIFIKAGLSGIDSYKLDIYQNFIDRRKISYDMFLNEKYFTLDPAYLPADEQKAEALKEEFALAKEVNRELISLLSPFSFEDEASVEEYCRKIYGFISQEPIKNSFLAYGEKLLEDNREEDRIRHRQIWDKLISLFDELVTLLGKERVSKELFCLLLEEGLESIKPAVIPPFKNQLFIADIKRSRVRGRKYTFLLGASASYLPSPIKDADILTKEEKDVLSSSGDFLPSMPGFSMEEEAYNFYLLSKRYKKRMDFSYPLKNMKNESQDESPFISNLREELGQEVKRKDSELEDVYFSRQTLFESMASYLRSNIKNDQMDKLLKEMSGKYKDRKMTGLLGQIGKNTKDRGPLDEDILKRLYPSRNISISQLQRLAACPYSYFIDYALKPEIDKNLEIDSLDFGNIIHKSLKDWADMGPDKLREMGEEESLKRLEDKFEDAKDLELDAIRQEDLKNTFIIKGAEKTIRQSHAKLFDRLAHSKIFKSYTEYEFSDRSQLPAIKLNIDDNSSIFIRGIIDRVDYVTDGEKEYAQVIDYKTGNTTFEIKDVINGSYLQLPIYLSAIKDAIPAGAFYMPIKALSSLELVDLKEETRDSDGDSETKKDKALQLKGQDKLSGFMVDSEINLLFDDRLEGKNKDSLYKMDGLKHQNVEKDNVLTKSELKDLLELALSKAEDLASIRQKGSISVSPLYYRGDREASACKYCDYKGLCHFEFDLDFSRQRMGKKLSWGQWRELRNKEKGAEE